jgi:hypothetical protein
LMIDRRRIIGIPYPGSSFRGARQREPEISCW